MVPDVVNVVQKLLNCTRLTLSALCLVSMTTWWAAGSSLHGGSTISLDPGSLALFVKRHKTPCNKVSKPW